MLLIACPHCRMERPEREFRYAGEAGLVRPAPDCDDRTWTDYLYFRKNPRGLHVERWHHIHGCGQFFEATRDTISDRFITESGRK